MSLCLFVCWFVTSLNEYESDEAVVIFDSIAVLQSMIKVIHFKDAFVIRASHLMKEVIFDSFLLRVVTQVQNPMKMSCHIISFWFKMRLSMNPWRMFSQTQSQIKTI